MRTLAAIVLGLLIAFFLIKVWPGPQIAGSGTTPHPVSALNDAQRMYVISTADGRNFTAAQRQELTKDVQDQTWTNTSFDDFKSKTQNAADTIEAKAENLGTGTASASPSATAAATSAPTVAPTQQPATGITPQQACQAVAPQGWGCDTSGHLIPPVSTGATVNTQPTVTSAPNTGASVAASGGGNTTTVGTTSGTTAQATGICSRDAMVQALGGLLVQQIGLCEFHWNSNGKDFVSAPIPQGIDATLDLGPVNAAFQGDGVARRFEAGTFWGNPSQFADSCAYLTHENQFAQQEGDPPTYAGNFPGCNGIPELSSVAGSVGIAPNGAASVQTSAQTQSQGTTQVAVNNSGCPTSPQDAATKLGGDASQWSDGGSDLGYHKWVFRGTKGVNTHLALANSGTYGDYDTFTGTAQKHAVDADSATFNCR